MILQKKKKVLTNDNQELTLPGFVIGLFEWLTCVYLCPLDTWKETVDKENNQII